MIDVRTAGVPGRPYVRQAINIPGDEIANRIAVFAPEHNARIVLYCRSGLPFRHRRTDTAAKLATVGSKIGAV